MELQLPAFKDSNPQLEVVTELIRGQHPHLKAFYSKSLPLPNTRAHLSIYIYFEKHLRAFCFLMLTENKNERVVCVKNMTPEDIFLHATRLRNALGRKVIKLKTRHVTKHPSVQGTWTTAVKF